MENTRVWQEQFLIKVGVSRASMLVPVLFKSQ